MKLRALATIAALLSTAALSRATTLDDIIATPAARQNAPNVLSAASMDSFMTINQSLVNNSPQSWIGCQVQITQTSPFMLTGVYVNNPGWTWSLVTPTQVGSAWIGYINYSGTPIAPNGALVFSYMMSFNPASSFGQQFTVTTVPEPSTVALVGSGLAGLLIYRRRSSAA